MDFEAYRAKKKAIESDCHKKIEALARDYALENSSVITGDIVTDNIGSIIVEKVKYTMGVSTRAPECCYWGIELTKKMNPRKDGSKRLVLQSNLLNFQSE